MGYRILTLLIFILPCIAVSAQEDDIHMIDTVVVAGETSFRVQRITEEQFENLATNYYTPPETPLTDIEEVKKMLAPEFSIKYEAIYYEEGDYYEYLLHEFRRHGKYRYIIQENEGFRAYYPQARIFKYYGGHSSDQAFHIDTGIEAWNPEYAAISADGNYRITGLHTGQESVEYRIEYKNEKQEYVLLAMLEEVTQQIPIEDIGYTLFIFKPFWVDGTLYFHTGGESWGELRCLSLKPLIGKL